MLQEHTLQLKRLHIILSLYNNKQYQENEFVKSGTKIKYYVSISINEMFAYIEVHILSNMHQRLIMMHNLIKLYSHP
jgi:hypothetical protein